ncbi:MAG: lipocalin-like domain-containing protein [Sulfuricaulis sp.]|nr:lipocalin-like domain-containing protein [Sulfuricaulis sp.]
MNTSLQEPSGPLLSYDIASRACRSPKAEWQPHAGQSEKSFEWWYVTALVHDAAGTPYFLVWLPVHFAGAKHLRAVKKIAEMLKPGQRLFIVNSALSNYRTGFHAADSEAVLVEEGALWNAENNELKFSGGRGVENAWSYDGCGLNLHAKMPRYSFDLRMDGGERVMWPKDKHGVEGFIQEGAENDFSFYYSLPRLTTTGTLSYTDDAGQAHTVDVTGFGWVDRQWGDWLTSWWEWASWRFANGARLNLYNFPGGHQVTTYQRADGTTEWLDGFIIRQNGYLKTPGGTWVSWGWSYELPVEVEGSRRFTVVPFSRNDNMHSGPVQFFEGAGQLIDDSSGQQVGISVNESMDVQAMGNGPYGAQQR